MIPRFFIDRPIFAAVMSVFITLAGAMSIKSLPVAQYPDIAPPTIQIDCNYPGASALVVSQAIAAPIEQQVNGVEDMLYMSSQCTSDGSYTCTITFQSGSDLNMAQVRVQNRVNLALPQLPDVVKATGVTTRKRSPELLLTVGLYSPAELPDYPNGRYDQLYLSNYAILKLREELQRLPGLSDVTVFGQRDYALRVWVDPDRLAGLNLTAADVVNALTQQNLALAAGQIGQPPTGEGQPYQLILNGVGRLVEVSEFENVVVKVGANRQIVRVRDVARVQLGAKLQDVNNRFDDKSTVGMAAFVLPDCNALETRDAITSAMERLSKDFPVGIKYEIGYDTTPFIRESIAEVFKSLRDSIILVSIVVLLFLQSWRAAVIPLAAVPVAIIGTFASLAVWGFSINLLTLFGLILAVGIVVDDAIVVVEAVQHQLEKGFTAREATIRAMDQVTAPIIAVGVVLTFVFVPCLFVPGIVGMFFKQFALTIASSTIISTFNSLTLSPALCVLLLKPKTAESVRRPMPRLAFGALGGLLGYLFLTRHVPVVVGWLPAGWQDRIGQLELWHAQVAAVAVGAVIGLALGGILNRLLAAFFAVFEWGFTISGRAYVKIVGLGLRIPIIALLGYATIVGSGITGFQTMPIGFIPQQDKGYLVGSIQLPDAASAERTDLLVSLLSRIALDYSVEIPASEGEEGAEKVKDGDGEKWVKKVHPVRHVNGIAGNSFVLSAYGSNFGSMFIILDDFVNRRNTKLTADAVAGDLRAKFAAAAPEAQVNIFGAPAVPRLGRAGGFRIMIEDRGDVGPDVLQGQTENLLDKANQQQQLVGLFTVYKTNSPQLFLDVDRSACVALGLDLNDVYNTLQATMGANYVNDFNRFGRTWQVNVQSDTSFRSKLEDVKKLKVRNKHGGMVPLGALLSVKEQSGPLVITRYNMYPAAPINGNITPGTSTGDGIAVLEKLCDQELPNRMSYEWTELTFLEKQARNTGATVFGMSVAFVFLVLAFLYESLAFPFAVLLVVPVCVACSLAAVWLTDPLSAAASVPAWNGWVANVHHMPDWLRGILTLGDNASQLGKSIDAGPIATTSRWMSAAGVGKQDVNVFTQVGFVVLIGLACKNAILIVEFARVAREKGADLRTAVIEACKLRYRPIMMTSVAFMLGVLPLAIAKGAGAEMRQAIGVAVLGGMMGVTLFGVVLTPVFFALVDRVTQSRIAHNYYVQGVCEGLRYVLTLGFVAHAFSATGTIVKTGVRRLRTRKVNAK